MRGRERKTTLTYLSYTHVNFSFTIQNQFSRYRTPAIWNITSIQRLSHSKLGCPEKHETKYIWMDCDSHRNGRLGMSRTLDDSMVVDCRESEKSPTTTCHHSTKPIRTQKEERKGGSQSSNTKMSRTLWFPRDLLV